MTNRESQRETRLASLGWFGIVGGKMFLVYLRGKSKGLLVDVRGFCCSVGTNLASSSVLLREDKRLFMFVNITPLKTGHKTHCNDIEQAHD